MSQPTFLLDTNILIPLEDNRPLDKPLSEFIRLCAEYGIHICVHEASIEDIKNDKNARRKEVTLSKIKKFLTSDKVITPEKEVLESLYGKINSENDYIDCRLLHAVDQIGLADFFLTQDQGIHKRARNADVADKLFTVVDALEWVKATFEPKKVNLPKVIEKFCHEIDKADSLFDTLREDYDGFDGWFKDCCKQRRKCWVIEQERQLAGIIIWKHEPLEEADVLRELNPKKIFKICTFKVSPAYRGERFGEQLLKQALWFSYRNNFDLCYLTVFIEKQVFLSRLIDLYGFTSFVKKVNGEECCIKRFKPLLNESNRLSPLEFLQNYYPTFRDDAEVSKFVIPIRPMFHEVIFPEIRTVVQSSFFDDVCSLANSGESFVPGNSIRKVYLSRAPCKQINEGDMILFYMSKGDNYVSSQSITTIGVVESVQWVSTIGELIKNTAKRSVYSLEELKNHIDHCQKKGKELAVINFFVCGHLPQPVRLAELKERYIFNGHPPQQPQRMTEAQYEALSSNFDIGILNA